VAFCAGTRTALLASVHSRRPTSTAHRTRSQLDPSPSDAGAMATIVLSSPAALVASLPYLVGFPPDESVVLVWLRSGDILLTQRADAPKRARPDWLMALWQHPAAAQADELIVLGVSSSPGVRDVVASVAEFACGRGMPVRDALVVSGGDWCSVLCEEPACGCSTPRTVPAAIRTAVGAEFTFRGVAPVASRRDLEAEVAPEPTPDVVRILGRRGVARPLTARALERWRDRAIDEAFSWRSTSAAPAPLSYARVIAGLQDIRVRDVVLWEMARLDDGLLRGTLPLWHRAVRISPQEFVAPVATVTSIQSWLLGDGARAAISLRRAREADQVYSLAHLVDAALTSGLPPQAWREGTAQLSRNVCRHGAGAQAATEVLART
jgi:hypothetical protein